MSERHRVGLRSTVLYLTLSVFALAEAPHARAQELTDAELVRRVEALMPEYEAARAARQARLIAAERPVTPPTPVDTVHIGPLRVVSQPGDVELARVLFTETWRSRFGGVTESPALRAHLFAFQWRARLRGFVIEPSPDAEVLRVEISRVWAPTREQASAVVADAIARALVADFPSSSPMRLWMTAQYDPTSEVAYRELAAGNTGASRDCFAGDVRACMAALGFGLSQSEGRLSDWFSDEERRGMVEDAGENGRVDLNGASYRRCVEENDARACNPMLAALDWVTSPPESDRLRAHLLWFTAREGGNEAWQLALAQQDAPMPQVLAAMAGRPIERLVEDWRAELIAGRPDVQAGLGGRGTRVLLWSLIFAALAMRSTRWRLA